MTPASRRRSSLQAAASAVAVVAALALAGCSSSGTGSAEPDWEAFSRYLTAVNPETSISPEQLDEAEAREWDCKQDGGTSRLTTMMILESGGSMDLVYAIPFFVCSEENAREVADEQADLFTPDQQSEIDAAFDRMADI